MIMRSVFGAGGCAARLKAPLVTGESFGLTDEQNDGTDGSTNTLPDNPRTERRSLTKSSGR